VAIVRVWCFRFIAEALPVHRWRAWLPQSGAALHLSDSHSNHTSDLALRAFWLYNGGLLVSRAVRFGHQRQEAIARREAGETLARLARSYAVDVSMISSLEP
jgi:hypothetical protein